MDNKTLETISERQQKEKKLLIEQLRRTPIIQMACEKVDIGRATYYRWRKEDAEFSKQSDQALLDGSLLINDMAESQLLSAVRDKNMTAITFWLKHRHAAYATRVELTTRIKDEDPKLTPEQQALVKKALEMASLIPPISEGVKDGE